MLRGVAYVDGAACRIHVDADSAEATLTFGGDEGEEPTVVTVLVEMAPALRLALAEATGDYFHVGRSLAYPDTRLPL